MWLVKVFSVIYLTAVCAAQRAPHVDPAKPHLKLLTSWMDVFQNETVQFICEVNGPNWTWYHNQNKLDQSNMNYEFVEDEPSLNITEITLNEQGAYACKAGLGGVSSDFSNTVNIIVYENIPTPKVTQDPSFNLMYTGETVKFTCNVDIASGWSYQWYKDGKELSETSETISISLQPSDKSKYSCMAIRGQTTTDYSEEISQNVLEIPVPSLTRKTQWLDVFPDESVQLSCGMSDSSDWIYTWHKDGQEVQANTHVSFDSNGATLFIKSASAAHAGQYTCSANIKGRSVNSIISSGLKLIVYDTKPRVTLMQNPSDNVLHTGDSVTFSCHINVSTGWEYLWYKDGVKLDESGNNHTISSVLTKDTGKYKCQTKRGRNTLTLNSEVTEAVNLNIKERPQADVSLLTGWSEVFSTDNLVLKCVVKESEEAWNYTWFKEDQPIDEPPTEKYTVTPQNNPEQSLYACQGIRNKRPFTSKPSDNYKTKNLLLKRRLLLSILGCIFFGIIAVFIGCIVLRVTRKPAKDEYRPEETELFFSMSPRKDGDDTPCPLVEYITDAALNAPPKEEEENGKICSDATPLPITQQEDEAVKTESSDATENNGGLVSFKQ
ncbi:hemicentin-1 [Larimichthys crocea]|uniref:hemicentin-1 n=1 Tax=Larimichthys crocea TaxID=215358 RepID=UPI000F5F3EDD|nr:hemicentin-1-like [Larimichthys crocea]